MKLDLEDFKETVRKEEVMYLATTKNNDVSIRTVSPLLIGDNTVCFYTSHNSEKYDQLKANPKAAFCVGMYGRYQAQGTVKFLGSVFNEENETIRELYKAKYHGAFEIAAPGEDMHTNEFIIIEIKLIKGWIFEGEMPVGLADLKFD